MGKEYINTKLRLHAPYMFSMSRDNSNLFPFPLNKGNKIYLEREFKIKGRKKQKSKLLG